MDHTTASGGAAGGRPRRGRPRDTTIDMRVLDASLTILEESGVREATIDAVADRAGVPKSTIYRRWPSKEALFVDALGRHVAQGIACPDLGSLDEELLCLVRAQIAMLTSGVGRAVGRFAFEVVAEGMPGPDHPFASDVKQVTRARRAGFDQAFRRAVERGEVSADVDITTAIDLLAGAVWSRLLSFEPFDADFAPAVVRTVLTGVSARRTELPG